MEKTSFEFLIHRIADAATAQGIKIPPTQLTASKNPTRGRTVGRTWSTDPTNATAPRCSIHLTSDLTRQIQAKALPETTQAAQSRCGDIRTNNVNPDIRKTKDTEKNMFRLAKEKKAGGNNDFRSSASMTLFKRNGIPRPL